MCFCPTIPSIELGRYFSANISMSFLVIVIVLLVHSFPEWINCQNNDVSYTNEWKVNTSCKCKEVAGCSKNKESEQSPYHKCKYNYKSNHTPSNSCNNVYVFK